MRWERTKDRDEGYREWERKNQTRRLLERKGSGEVGWHTGGREVDGKALGSGKKWELEWSFAEPWKLRPRPAEKDASVGQTRKQNARNGLELGGGGGGKPSQDPQRGRTTLTGTLQKRLDRRCARRLWSRRFRKQGRERAELNSERKRKASRNNMQSQCREGEGNGQSHSLNVSIRVWKARMCVLEYSHCPGNTAWLLSKWWSGWGHTSEQITLVCFVGCLLAGWQPG